MSLHSIEAATFVLDCTATLLLLFKLESSAGGGTRIFDAQLFMHDDGCLLNMSKSFTFNISRN